MAHFPTLAWPDFTIGPAVYTFEHLAEFSFLAKDSSGVSRHILVTYTDHVFTRDTEPSDDPADAFPKCSRHPTGHLCPIRYGLSLTLPSLIAAVETQKIWNLTGDDRYTQLPVVTHNGSLGLYAIVFTLDKAKGLPFDLRMHIRSAHLCDRKPPDTFGEVRFPHLVKLRVERKHPVRVYGHNRKVPKMP